MAAAPDISSAEPGRHDHTTPAPRTDAEHDHDTVDGQEFAELYRRHSAVVYRFLVGRTYGDVHLAEDLLQETFLRAWRSSHVIVGHAQDCRPWLITVARNLLVDWLRSRACRPRETDTAALPSVAESHCEMDRVVTALTVRQAMATLTPVRREILVQIYLKDRPVGQLAESLGIPEGTVKSRAHCALRALRLALADHRQADREDEQCAA